MLAPAVRIAERVYIIRPEAAHRAFCEIGGVVRNATEEARSLAFRLRLGYGRQHLIAAQICEAPGLAALVFLFG